MRRQAANQLKRDAARRQRDNAPKVARRCWHQTAYRRRCDQVSSRPQISLMKGSVESVGYIAARLPKKPTRSPSGPRRFDL